MDEILFRIENEQVNMFGQIQIQLTKILILLIDQRTYRKGHEILQTKYLDFDLKGIIQIEFWKEYLEKLQAKLKRKNLKTQQQQFPIGNTAGLSYQQLKAQKITSLQQVQHKNGNFVYEATLQDGNKLLMPHNPNNNNELTFPKNIDATGKNQYKRCNNHQRDKVRNLTQNPFKQRKWIMNSKKLKYNGKQKGQQQEHLADRLLTVQWNRCIKIRQRFICFCFYLGEQFHTVGIGLTAFMTSITVGGVILSDCLSQSEKVYNFDCSENWKCYRIRQGGIELGAAGGPIGGFFGEESSNLFGRAVDHFTQFNLQIDFNYFNSNQKSKVEDGYLTYLATSLKISWKYVKNNIKSLIRMAQTDTHMAFLIPNIDRNRTEIQENEDIGIQFNECKKKRS
ncbi:unnamed protein product [Paramecium pentaurelia]|uniref:Uncharacterized protein n=1 Tax=Paramecium pentaurelia TaxID=43138 RepID=A0A8S1Y698_9CILI|nr:unnamed protein product [Paramecium pentaurelia]